MQDKESNLPEDWFNKGDDDKQAVGILLEHGGKSSVAAFLIQQMLEKYMKGFLLSKRWKLKRTHDLEELLDEMVGFDPTFEDLKLIGKVEKLHKQIGE
jgi:HEPN domain-containing protein